MKLRYKKLVFATLVFQSLSSLNLSLAIYALDFVCVSMLDFVSVSRGAIDLDDGTAVDWVADGTAGSGIAGSGIFFAASGFPLRALSFCSQKRKIKN